MFDGHMIGFGGGFMWLFWLLLIVIVVWAVSAVAGRGGTTAEKQRSALDMLKERYAKGEIDQQEFEQKRKDLDG